MENMQQMMYQMHLWPIFGLILLVAVNIFAILLQRDDRKLKKYLRIQAIVWVTLMSMIVFTGAATMATLKMWFNVKIDMMIVATIAVSFLELRRHWVLNQVRCDETCFDRARKKMLRYYIFEFLWLAMMLLAIPRL